MSAKYTAGKWEATQVRAFDGVGLAFDIEVPGVSVAHVYPCEDMEANARLIASAPELLQCLMLLLKMYRDGDVTSDVLEECDSAITKATGTDLPAQS